MKSLALFGLGLAAVISTSGASLKSGIDPQHMDPSVRFQDDLYLAIVGKWIAHGEIPPDKANYGAFNALDDLSRDRAQSIVRRIVGQPQKPGSDEQKIRDMYSSFMDEEAVERKGLEPLRVDLAAIDGIRTHDEVARAFATFGKVGVTGPLVFSSELDAKNSRVYVAALTQSGLTLPDRDYYLQNENRYLEARAFLVAYLIKLFTLAGAQEVEAKDAAEKSLALETSLARGQWSRTELRDPQRNYNIFKLTELATLAPGFPWAGYLSELGLSVDAINVEQPTYAQQVATLLTSTPVEDWKAYLKARTLDCFAPSLTRAFQEAHFELHGKKINGVAMQKTREKRALEAIGGGLAPGDFGVLGDVVGRLYVQEFFPPDAKARMDKLVGNLLAAYRESINGLSWMSPATKKRAQEKLSKYRVKIGYTEKWRDYSGLKITPDDLLGNIKASAQYEFDRHRKNLTSPVDPYEWAMTPQTVNAYYSPPRNEIVFPAAILQPPFFNVEADDAVNYGAIGAVIGHEISHGFDDKGSQFDGDGNLSNWWTDDDRKAFDVLTAKLVAQYSEYEPMPGKKLNGQLTVGENIADLSGLAIAYKAYKLSLAGKEAPVIDGYTGDQRFFLGWAQAWRRKYRDADLARRLIVDSHSPSHYRAIGAPINNDAFHEAFKTKPGDKMYKAKEDRIQIW